MLSQLLPRLLFLVLSIALSGCSVRSDEPVDLSALPERFTNSLGIEMVLIPGGAFEMGRDVDFGPGIGLHDGPRHPVEVSPFYMSRSEVTKAQFQAYVDATQRDRLPELDPANQGKEHRWAYDLAPGPDRPIYAAPWDPCKRFTQWLAKLEAVPYRLPTEAEWEFAAKAGSSSHWWWGDEPLGGSYTHRSTGKDRHVYTGVTPAGVFPANPWGLYDMYGNAGEWCEDWWQPGYGSASLQIDPGGPLYSPSGRKVQRGGWLLGTPDLQNSYFRLGGTRDSPIGGIRLVLPVRPGFQLPASAVAKPWRRKVPKPSQVGPESPLQSLVVDLGQGVTIELLRVEPGRFVMGSPEDEPGRSPWEGPQTTVIMNQAYYLSKYEVTQRQWQAILGERIAPGQGQADLPVRQVTWQELYRVLPEFTERQRASGDLGPADAYRLPFEYEWEHACRAGSPTQYPFGAGEAMLPEHAHYDAPWGPLPVGRLRPNQWGFHDMLGNVWEWTLNRPYEFPGGEVVGSKITRFGGTAYAVVKGGAYNFGAITCRPAMRQVFDGRQEFPWVGFRLLRTIEPE